MCKKYGYARVSTREQNEDRQILQSKGNAEWGIMNISFLIWMGR